MHSLSPLKLLNVLRFCFLLIFPFLHTCNKCISKCWWLALGALDIGWILLIILVANFQCCHLPSGTLTKLLTIPIFKRKMNAPHGPWLPDRTLSNSKRLVEILWMFPFKIPFNLHSLHFQKIPWTSPSKHHANHHVYSNGFPHENPIQTTMLNGEFPWAHPIKTTVRS